MPRHSSRKKRQTIHPSRGNNDNNNTNPSNQTLLSSESSPSLANHSSIPIGERPNPLDRSISMQSISATKTDGINLEQRNGTTGQLITNLLTPSTNLASTRSTSSLLARLTDARKTLFGKSNVPNPFFSSTDQNKALLSYILSEPYPKLHVIQEYEQNGAQLNAITDDGNTAIHLFARAQYQSLECINIVDYLTKKGSDPNRQNDFGWTAAHYALASHNTDLVIFLLKLMIDVNLSTFEAHNGYTSQTQLLHIAAKRNDPVITRLLIKTYKARINVFNEEGCTPLHVCCYENNIDALKALLENDADFQKGTRLNLNETPVSICVKYQNDLCLKALFDSTTHFNWKRYFGQLPRSPLLCDFPTIYAIDLLVQYSLDINACDERGNTFLHYLVNKTDVDYERYIEKLIQYSADFNKQNKLGRTPFLQALEQKNFQLTAIFLRHIDITNINITDSLSNTALHYCKYLLDENYIYETVLQSNPSSLNAQNRDGQTPLHDAILSGNYPLARFLLQQGADLTIVNKDGNTPLHLAAQHDNTTMCRLLMKYPQIDLTAINKMGKTPLHLACANEKPNVAAILINKLRTDQINLLDIHGRTPLHECADNIDGSLAGYLIRHGADENSNDGGKNTILHLASEKGNIELVRTLIKSSINVNQLNVDYRSPLSLAILHNHDELSKYLISQDVVLVQLADLKMAMQINNYEMVKLLIEKDRSCLRLRSAVHGDMIVHVFMRKNYNNLVCLEALLSFISDNELLTYLSESSLSYGDNLLHIAAREDTPNALTCFLNLSRVQFWFWANMMLTKNNENKTPMELANEFKHYAVIKLINSKWKESYEYLSHSLRDGHCGVSSTGVTQAKRKCYNCNQTGFVETVSRQKVRPCIKCNVCLYKSLDNSMQTFLALLFSDESSTIALDIMDSLIVINEVQKIVHLYLDHIEPWEEFDKIDLNDSTSILHQFITTNNTREKKNSTKDTSSPYLPINGDSSSIIYPANMTSKSQISSRPSITTVCRPDGTHFRFITPLEAIYYHERLDLVTHPLVKGLIKWKWDNYASKRFYITLLLELIFLTLWTCTLLIGRFSIRYNYIFPGDIWRCVLWGMSILFLIWGIVQEIFDMIYARKRYADYLIWETERTKNRMDLISLNKYKSSTNASSIISQRKKPETTLKNANETLDIEQTIIDETLPKINTTKIRSQYSPNDPLPTVIKGKPAEPQPNYQQPIDAPNYANDMSSYNSNEIKTKNGTNRTQIKSSRFLQFFQRINSRIRARVKSYYMYYSLNNLFDWIVYILCLVSTITHFVDVGQHTVTRARIHMYVASSTVICIWFRFMVFFRSITISMKSLRSKLVEIKLGELVIMVRMMFDDIIRFLMVFVFLLAPYAFVFYSMYGSQQIPQVDYERAPALCEGALIDCSIVEISSIQNGDDSSPNKNQYAFNSTKPELIEFCYNATNSCRLHETDGFGTFYALLFSIFRIALVDEIPIDSFNLIDRYFSAFVCSTYLLFTAILSINIFIGLISNALQTEAFSTVEARFLLERIEIILNYEWRLSARRRLQLQEVIHRQCAPLQLNWKEINFDPLGQSREEQNTKAFARFRQTVDKYGVQLDTFRTQVQQKLSDLESIFNKLPFVTTTNQQTRTPQTVTNSTETKEKKTKANESLEPSKPSSPRQSTEQLNIPIIQEPTVNIAEELIRLRELVEDALTGQNNRTGNNIRSSMGSFGTITTRPSVVNQSVHQHHLQSQQQSTEIQNFSKDINDRVTDLQLAVNRLHQDVTTIRQVVERMSPLSTSLILGRTVGRR